MNGTFMTNKQTKNKVELPKIGSSDQYNHLMKIIQNRVTVRKFDENYIVPDKHFEMIIIIIVRLIINVMTLLSEKGM